MAILPLVLISSLASVCQASDQLSRALELNAELEFLLGEATRTRIWRDTSLPAQSERSGPSTPQIEGVENLEDRFFKDEVSFQAARSKSLQDDEPEFDEIEKSYRVDGSLPKTR